MNVIDIWLTIGMMTIATILARGSFFLLGHAVKLPPKVQHALRYAPAAALAAIVAPDLLLPDGVLQLSWSNPKLMAAIGASVFFLKTRHMLATILTGMGLFTLLRVML